MVNYSSIEYNILMRDLRHKGSLFVDNNVFSKNQWQSVVSSWISKSSYIMLYTYGQRILYKNERQDNRFEVIHEWECMSFNEKYNKLQLFDEDEKGNMAVIEHMKSHHSKIRINLGHAMNMSLTLLKTKNRNLKMNGTFSEVIILKLISIKMNPEGALKPSKFMCNCCGKVVFETNFTGNGSPTAKRWFKILYSDLITHFIGSEEGEDVCLKLSSVQLELLLESMMNDLNWWNSTDNPSNNHIHQFFWS